MLAIRFLLNQEKSWSADPMANKDSTITISRYRQRSSLMADTDKVAPSCRQDRNCEPPFLSKKLSNSVRSYFSLIFSFWKTETLLLLLHVQTQSAKRLCSCQLCNWFKRLYKHRRDETKATKRWEKIQTFQYKGRISPFNAEKRVSQ